MLNRLYIVIGVLAILVLGGGFLVPGWINWEGYRDRLESMAEAELGTDIIIAGDIDFTLLPQPRMQFGATIVGPADAPIIEIGGLVAEFSLMDFLRDRLNVTRLVLQSPIVSVSVSESGALEIPFVLPESFGASRLTIANAQVINGTFRFADKRSGDMWQVKNFEGEVRVSDVRGPYSLQGTGDFGGRTHAVRLNTSSVRANGEMQASTFIRAADGAYTLGAEGVVTLGARPTFKGQATFRGAPDTAHEADNVKGDFVLVSEVDVSSEKILLSEFSIQPDENRSSTRLSGAAEVQLGDIRSFDAVISGGVVALAPRDLRMQTVHDPYELVRLLDELPPLFVPPIAGRIGVDIAELDLRAFSLRDVLIDATTDGEVWDLGKFAAQLPGQSLLTLTGRLFDDEGKTGYEGAIALTSERPDVLANLWHPLEDGNPLFNRKLDLGADLSLKSGEMSLANGTLVLDEGAAHTFAGLFNLAGTRNALVTARFGVLGGNESEAVMALLPDFVDDASAGNTFPVGSLDVAVEEASLLGLKGSNFSLQADWGPEGGRFERFVVQDYGGARFSLSGNMSGTLLEPVLSGGGRLTLSQGAQTGFLALVSERMGVPADVMNLASRALPFDANVDLSPPDAGGEQGISIAGRAGVLDMQLELVLSGGIDQFTSGPILIEALTRSEDADALNRQLGLGELSLFASEGPLLLNLRAQGVLSKSIETTIVAQRGNERLGFAGRVLPFGAAGFSGSGIVDFAVSDFSPMLDLVGVNGIHLAGLEGSADISFGGSGMLMMENLIASRFGTVGATLGGQLSISEVNDKRLVVGQLQIGTLGADSVLAFLGGPAAFIISDGVWPDGPLDLGGAPRQTRGRISLTAPGISFGNINFASEVSLDLIWDANKVALENISGQNNSGSISGRLEVCCSGPGAQKQLSGRLSITGVPLEGLVPAGIAENLDGVFDGGMLFSATGASVAEMVETLSGEGSFSVTDLEIAKFSPTAFSALKEVGGIAELDAEALRKIVAAALNEGSFEIPALGGAFRLAGGKVQADNMAVQGEEALLLGGLGLDLRDLSISGTWTMTPTRLDDPEGLIDENTARISAALGGTLFEPERNIDLGSMVDAIQFRALEIELARLEQLRAEQEERAARAAAERARLMELERQRLEAEAARLAAEAEAHRIADEAARLSEERQNLIFDLDSGDPLALDPAETDPPGFDPLATDPLILDPPPPDAQ